MPYEPTGSMAVSAQGGADQTLSDTTDFGGNQTFDLTVAPAQVPPKKISDKIKLFTDSISPGVYKGKLTLGLGISVFGVTANPNAQPPQQSVTTSISVARPKCKVTTFPE